MTGIDNVHLELSNRCGYARAHKLCPNDADAPPYNLPLSIIEDVLDELGMADYSGALLFSVYNEPLTDPRLFLVLDIVRCLCPNAKPYMHTNSWNLDQTMLDELARFGMTRIYANAYTDGEHDRIAALSCPNGATFHRHKPALDDRNGIYGAPYHGRNIPCHALGRQVLVWCSGEVGLCCMDWRKSVVFGSLHEQSLSDILAGERRAELSEQLMRGERSCADVCSGCTRPFGPAVKYD